MEMSLREFSTEAIRYWEPRRVLYNIVLSAIVITYFVRDLPQSKDLLTLDFFLVLTMLAVLANVVYCAAYIVDLFAQASGFRQEWRQYRWVLLAIGIVFAGIITRFVALAMFLPPASEP